MTISENNLGKPLDAVDVGHRDGDFHGATRANSGNIMDEIEVVVKMEPTRQNWHITRQRSIRDMQTNV
jgi:hypothetical protein